MKKLLILLLTAALLLPFSACGGQNETPAEADTVTAAPGGEDNGTPTASLTDETEYPSEDPAEEPTEPDTQPAEGPAQPADTEPADGIYMSDHPKACCAALSFDECDAWAGDRVLKVFFEPGHPDDLPMTVSVPGEVTAVRFWGWVGLSQEAAALGYRVDKGDPIFDDAFFREADDAVRGAAASFGAADVTRFEIFADLTTVDSGVHTLQALCRLSDGTVFVLAAARVNIGYRTPGLTDTTRRFVSSVDGNGDGVNLDASDLASFFVVELPLQGMAGLESTVGGGVYRMRGISDMYAQMDGNYRYVVEIADISGLTPAAGAFVRGYGALYSDDVPSIIAEENLYPINNFYETDNAGGTGGVGIYVNVDDGKLLLTVKQYDPENPERVGNVMWTWDVSGTADAGRLTFFDKDNVVSIYAGDELITAITLSGSVEYDDLNTPGASVRFAKTATFTSPDGETVTVENTLVVDSAACQIGVVGRGVNVDYTYVEVGAPLPEA